MTQKNVVKTLTGTIDVSCSCDSGVHCFVFAGCLPARVILLLFFLCGTVFSISCRAINRSTLIQSIEVFETTGPKGLRLDGYSTLAWPPLRADSVRISFETVHDCCRSCVGQEVACHVAAFKSPQTRAQGTAYATRKYYPIPSG